MLATTTIKTAKKELELTIVGVLPVTLQPVLMQDVWTPHAEVAPLLEEAGYAYGVFDLNGFPLRS